MTAWTAIALQAVPGPPLDDGTAAARTIVGLVVVMIALAGFLWLLKRGTFAGRGRAGRPALAVESAISLGDRRSLVIVTVEGRRLLLGASPSQISFITELTRPDSTFGTALEGAMASPGESRRA
jgi:flagellar protein FliO/FliZ